MRSGIDQIEKIESLLDGRKAGLITNPTGVDCKLISSIDKLLPYLNCLFGPEHGIRAIVQDELAVDHGRDSRTGLTEYSLFGEVIAPTEEMLSGLDALIFDIQDVGVRFYTYGATMALSMQAAAKAGIRFIVLDRPNPLGRAVEGLLRPDAYQSFLSFSPVCTRHGLTMGELALYMQKILNLNLDLQIVPVEGWHGEPLTDESLWIPPSPNMPSLSTTRVYPGTCLVEGTTVAEGRGTTKPFEWLGAPWLDGQELADRLNAYSQPGCLFRPVSFAPLGFKHEGKTCQGIQIHVTDLDVFQPVRMGVVLIRTLQAMSGENWSWRYLPEYHHYMIDLLHGDDSLRMGRPMEEIFDRMTEDEKKFKQVTEDCLLYGK